jgi:methylenetetrahydrofolate dehydrogenase (NADP+)/methenyltetrahydrofolate cyclohydrolase
MPARILDGKALAESLRTQTAADVASFTRRTAVTPGLAVVLVGDDPASQVYVRNKSRACREAGINAQLIRLGPSTSEASLLATVAGLCDDPKVHGILVQLPLPKHINESRVIDAIHPLKDVDGFHPTNAGLLATGRPRFVPCTPLGVKALLRHAGVATRGARTWWAVPWPNSCSRRAKSATRR